MLDRSLESSGLYTTEHADAASTVIHNAIQSYLIILYKSTVKL